MIIRAPFFGWLLYKDTRTKKRGKKGTTGLPRKLDMDWDL